MYVYSVWTACTHSYISIVIVAIVVLYIIFLCYTYSCTTTCRLYNNHNGNSPPTRNVMKTRLSKFYIMREYSLKIVNDFNVSLCIRNFCQSYSDIFFLFLYCIICVPRGWSRPRCNYTLPGTLSSYSIDLMGFVFIFSLLAAEPPAMNFADTFHERRRGRVFVDDPLSSLEQEILLFRHNNIQKFQQGYCRIVHYYMLKTFDYPKGNKSILCAYLCIN